MNRPSGRLLAIGVLLSGLLWSRGLPLEAPCDKGTFREVPGQKCVPCDLCDGDHREYQRPCSETSNAVCRCREGYCGPACQRCPCSAGQMWTPQGCQNCSRGKFNNRAWGSCHPFPITATPPRVVTTRLHPSETDPWLGVVAAALVVALLLWLALMLFCVSFRLWAKEKFWKGPQRQPVQEVDDHTYRYPEEEEGEDSDPSCPKGEPHLLEKVP